ncbi:AmmeMemoRadiSam system radical SAM enzyme [compost metagenome]|uniref:Pyruvate formate lyase activating enzyme n=1 Tax=Pseudomonas jinjuensis TaxID=198616 RepID=A0A1H0GB92_9PSED|nr:AmmeMemoRadiSam system radical SAM enzyme [Pseudomonas jinjuensis]SDO04136.1 pyruvate formate lyase activating enzyme [Pseudomonas jinjuensis]
MNHPGRWWHALEDGRIQCDLCPRECKLHDGQRAACFVRMREGDQVVLTTYGRSSGFCIDPIEKKPLNHFLPGSSVLSFGTAGCNLACKFCQNWDISKSRDMDRLMDSAAPDAIARAAREVGAASVAFTYNDPVIFAEYAIDIAAECRKLGVHSVAVTAGYIGRSARGEFYAAMDAANVDLKGFTEDFYTRFCGAHLAPVLDTLQFIHHETDTWLEITTLLIPDANDSDAEITALSRWVARELSPQVPLHFTAFHPDFKLTDRSRTPHETLLRARRIALDEGLQHVYVGNVVDLEGATTYCAQCKAPLIVRNYYAIVDYRLGEDGCCPDCGSRLVGHFDSRAGHFGNRRIPVRLAS